MPKQENTAINDLIGLVSRKPIDEVDEPALFSTSPPGARLRPAPFGGHLSPIGAVIAPLPRRRAPAATPPQVPLHSDYGDDAATTIDPPATWAAPPPAPVVHHADTGPFAPQPLPQPPYVPPAPAGYAYPVRPEYPQPNEPPAYYQAPYADHLDTMRVRPMPLDPDLSLGREVLQWVARLWIPFAALGVISIVLAGYRILRDNHETEAPPHEAPIVMTTEPSEPVAAPIVAEPIVAEPAVVEPAVVEPVAAGAVPKDSLWQPTTPQPTIAPPADIVVVADPEVDIEPAAEVKPSARSSNDRSSSRRAAKRAASKRAKQIALTEMTPTKKPATREKPVAAVESRDVVAIAPAKPMKIGAATVAGAKGTGGPGKLAITSTPSTLIYVDGRNTGMMTPKTLSLPVGSHKITLLSPKDRIAKTIAVEIEAGKSARLTKDFTK